MLTCKLQRFVKSVFGYYANWLIIVFTIFRAIAVYFPHKANVFCSRRRAFFTVCLTFAVCFLVNLDSVINIEYLPKNSRKKCWFTGSRDVYYTVYSQWLMLVTMSIIPFVVLVTGNVMIIHKILIYSLQRTNMSNETKSNDSQSMTAMLISISVLFLVTQVPAFIILILRRILIIENFNRDHLHRFLVINSVFRLFKWSNHAVNFFCYCVSGKRFQEELVAMVTGRLRRKGQWDGSMGTKSSAATASSNNVNSL